MIHARSGKLLVSRRLSTELITKAPPPITLLLTSYQRSRPSPPQCIFLSSSWQISITPTPPAFWMALATLFTIALCLRKFGLGSLAIGIMSWNGSSSLASAQGWMAVPIKTDLSADVLALIMAWWITFTVVMSLLMTVGFGPVGVGAGTSEGPGKSSLRCHSHISC